MGVQEGKARGDCRNTRFQTVIRKSGAVVRVAQPQGTSASAEPLQEQPAVQAGPPTKP